MAGGKLSPRQKMINMMYLVLIALLALNVSKEVLNAFKIVGKSMDASNEAIVGKNENYYGVLAGVPQEDDFSKGLSSITTRTQATSSELYDYIDAIKNELRETVGYEENSQSGEVEYVKPDDIDIASVMLAEGPKGVELKEKIETAQKDFTKIIEDLEVLIGDDKAGDILINSMSLQIQDPPASAGKDWQTYNFYHMPVVGVDVLLAKFQNDAISTESQILEFITKQIGKNKEFKIEKLSAKVIAPKSYLPSGKTYESDIFISASFAAEVPNEVFLGALDMEKIRIDSFGDFEEYVAESKDDFPFNGEATPVDVSGGVGKYTAMASGVGERKYSGAIRVLQPTGEYKFYPFESTYEVAPPGGFSVAATKMNVFYIGVDNPVSITVGGTKSDADVVASMTGAGGSITKSGNGKYNVRVSSVGDCNVNVSAKIDGDMKSMGPSAFRAKRIPDPLPTLGGKLKGGKIQKGTLAAQSGLVAVLDNFDFEARFNITSFTVVYSKAGDVFRTKCNGPIVSSTAKSYMQGAKPKEIIVFTDIKAKGPDGVPRKLPDMLFEII